MQTQEIQIKISKKIKDLRLMNDWTQEQAASQLHICRNAYSDIELGKTDLALSRLIQLANFYKVDVGYFVSEYGKVVFYLTGNHNAQTDTNEIETPCNECHGSLIEEKLYNKVEEMQAKLDQAKEVEIQLLKEQIEQLKETNALLKKNQ